MVRSYSEETLPDESVSSGGLSYHEGWCDLYNDRTVSPSDTLMLASRAFARLGVTRVADQTGLDRVGIPCFAAFRPNAMTIASSQGKGLTKEAAKASAVMEAVELAVAEQPRAKTQLATLSDLISQGHQTVDIRTQLPIGFEFPADKELEWVSGYSLTTRKEVKIPLDAVSMDIANNRLPGICAGTNGLASGNTEAEAVFHGLCELIERDGRSLWSLYSDDVQPLTAIDSTTWQDDEVVGLLCKVEQAGLTISLFDQTSDIGIPCVMAIIGEPEKTETRHFDLAAGYGAHPNATRAAIRAITEAAQTRITSIAGSRDDIDPGQYKRVASPAHLKLLELVPIRRRPMSEGLSLGIPLSDLLAVTAMSAHAISETDDVYVFPLSDESFDFSVVKVVAPALEDRFANSNWRPKSRALNVLLNT